MDGHGRGQEFREGGHLDDGRSFGRGPGRGLVRTDLVVTPLRLFLVFRCGFGRHASIRAAAEDGVGAGRW